MQPASLQPSWRVCCRGLERREIAEVRDAPEQPRRLDADGLADGHDSRDGIEQLDAVGRRLDAELQTVVLDAHSHRGYAGTRPSNRLGLERSARRLDREGRSDVSGFN